MFSRSRRASLRSVITGVFTIAILLPGSVSAATEAPSTGTLIGSVTCGADGLAPAINAVVAPEGLSLQTRTNSAGQFTLSNVPAARMLTIDAASDSQGTAETTRYNVAVQPGETLDIGSMDLVICPSVNVLTPNQDDTNLQEQRGPY
jgi:hypothetical protein